MLIDMRGTVRTVRVAAVLMGGLAAGGCASGTPPTVNDSDVVLAHPTFDFQGDLGIYPR